MLHEEIFSKYPPAEDNLLSLLIDLQAHSPQNYLSREAMEEAARYFNVSKARVYGLAGYYSMLCTEPRGRHVIRLCRSPVCRMFGTFDVARELEGELGIRFGETTEDGLFTLEYSECLGRCNHSPTMMVGARFYGRLDGEKIRYIIDHLREESAREAER
ncbi:MAG: NAD(P)H-dependent oxidoreductase subunit E [Spirochaetaceae bacterium]